MNCLSTLKSTTEIIQLSNELSKHTKKYHRNNSIKGNLYMLCISNELPKHTKK